VLEVRSRFPELYTAWRERPHAVAIPDGESPLGLSLERLWSVHVRPAAISEREYGDRWTAVQQVNIQSHLDRLAGVRRS